MSESLPGLPEFLDWQPRMTLRPAREGEVVICGPFTFSAKTDDRPLIEDTYSVEITVPAGFPRAMPSVVEVDRRIPRDGNFHVNGDGTLCLGSELKARLLLARNPTLIGFGKNCLIPYLYGISHALEHGRFPWGELDHGTPGVLSDYKEMFGLGGDDEVFAALELLGMKRSAANKKRCPCGCGGRYGRCGFRNRLERFRNLGSNRWFREHLEDLKVAIGRERRLRQEPSRAARWAT